MYAYFSHHLGIKKRFNKSLFYNTWQISKTRPWWFDKILKRLFVHIQVVRLESMVWILIDFI